MTNTEQVPTPWAYEQACKALAKHKEREQALAEAIQPLLKCCNGQCKRAERARAALALHRDQREKLPPQGEKT